MKIIEHVRTTVHSDILRTDHTVWHDIQLVVNTKVCTEIHHLVYNEARDISILVGVMHFMAQYEYW